MSRISVKAAPSAIAVFGEAEHCVDDLSYAVNCVVLIQPPISPNLNYNPNFNSSATIPSLVKSFPYNLSISVVSSLVSPYGSNLVVSELRSPFSDLNITKALIDGHRFNVAASILSASCLIDEFEASAGITLFVPTDCLRQPLMKLELDELCYFLH